MSAKTEDLLFWVGLAAVGTAYEVHALRTERGDRTLSHFTRAVFRTDTKPGRMAFAVAVAWFTHHILTGRNTP